MKDLVDYNLFEIDLLIILTDLDIDSNLLNNTEPMKPINPNQEQTTNRAFIIVLLLLPWRNW
ncbi:hypothetical protein [Thalassobellus suaedae]|uniref:Uncharacterized protein n=1 Tax=Thalassobellus suaedae TaxID=3074124 RepID=A0ABY9XVU0_9FLAO|nr:hypothetical protein RHP51_05085 [Flavobacteriaceae bacterium HL-DH14]